MPYIEEHDREKLQPLKRQIQKTLLETPSITAGDMNYLVHMLSYYFLLRRGINYSNLNELIGVLECAKLELYRRRCSPYEDEKIESNGDIW
jgi:hypothetical protein